MRTNARPDTKPDDTASSSVCELKVRCARHAELMKKRTTWRNLFIGSSRMTSRQIITKICVGGLYRVFVFQTLVLDLHGVLL
jgi:hypothetical protein